MTVPRMPSGVLTMSCSCDAVWGRHRESAGLVHGAGPLRTKHGRHCPAVPAALPATQALQLYCSTTQACAGRTHARKRSDKDSLHTLKPKGASSALSVTMAGFFFAAFTMMHRGLYCITGVLRCRSSLLLQRSLWQTTAGCRLQWLARRAVLASQHPL